MSLTIEVPGRGPALVAPAKIRSRLTDIDRSKGMAILIILFAHIVAREPPAGHDWYLFVKHSILEVTVLPFFMYISGIIAIRAIVRIASVGAYLRFVRDRAARLLLPFFIFGLCVIAGKLIASRFMFVDNRPSDVADSIVSLLWHTHRSAALSVWFLYTLFALCAAMPILLVMSRNRFWALLALAIPLYFWNAPDYFYLDRVVQNLPAFIVGCWVARDYPGYTAFIDRWCYALVLLNVAALLLLTADLDMHLHYLLISLTFLPALHAVVRSPLLRNSTSLLWLGEYTFVIYLLNTIFIGLTKGIVLKFWSWDGSAFLAIGPLLYLSGLFGPVWAKRYVLRRIPLLDKWTE